MKQFKKPRSGGRHRSPSTGAVAAVTLAAMVGAAFVNAGVAIAAPTQPGITAPSQPGITTPPPASEQPGITTAPEVPAPTSDRSYWTPPPAEYDNIQWKPSPSTQQSSPNNAGDSSGNYVAPAYYGDPIDVGTLHLPTEVEIIAPIEAPPQMLQLGDYVGPKPNWMSDEYLERTNNTASVGVSQFATFWSSVGVDVDRSQRVSAATFGGAAAGALAAGTAGFTVGALGGGTVGGLIGAGMGGLVPLPPPLPEATTGVVGTAIGAGAGGLLLGIPSAVGGAVVGGLTAGAIGAGDTDAEPRHIDVPNLPEPDAPAITSQTSDALAAQTPQVAQVVTDAVASVPQITENINAQLTTAREGVLAQPGGDQVIAALDNAAVEANYAFGPTADLIGQALGAAAAGVTPA
ncbi:MAG: insoluble domain protein [Rhodococcus sp.]|nr:insoluble domain protein [Rhodococcus sp. (in: high G+C Gram-positive bacteria)]